MSASTSASLSREREVAAHFSTSAIKGKINSYRSQVISSMLCAHQTLEYGSLLFLCFCSTDQVAKWMFTEVAEAQYWLLGCTWSRSTQSLPGPSKPCTWPFTKMCQNILMLLVAVTGRVAIMYNSMWESRGIKSHHSISWNCQSFFETSCLLFTLLKVIVLPLKA